MVASLPFGTLRLNSFAALRPRMLRFCFSERNGRFAIEFGGLKSQCGQSDENSSWLSALTASNVASVSFKLLVSSGCEVKNISRMYSLGRRFKSGASELRIRYSLSSRCIRNGTQARPLSIQITLSFG